MHSRGDAPATRSRGVPTAAQLYRAVHVAQGASPTS